MSRLSVFLAVLLFAGLVMNGSGAFWVTGEGARVIYDASIDAGNFTQHTIGAPATIAKLMESVGVKTVRVGSIGTGDNAIDMAICQKGNELYYVATEGISLGPNSLIEESNNGYAIVDAERNISFLVLPIHLS
jgi:hypothetical protein